MLTDVHLISGMGLSGVDGLWPIVHNTYNLNSWNLKAHLWWELWTQYHIASWEEVWAIYKVRSSHSTKRVRKKEFTCTPPPPPPTLPCIVRVSCHSSSSSKTVLWKIFLFAQCTCWGVYVSTRLPMLNTSLALRVFLLRLSVRSVRCFHVSSYTGGDGTDRVCARPLSYMSLSPHVFLSYVLRSFPSRRLCAWPSERAGLRQPLTSCTGRWVIRFLGTVSTWLFIVVQVLNLRLTSSRRLAASLLIFVN
jgi:hypothetical protein